MILLVVFSKNMSLNTTFVSINNIIKSTHSYCFELTTQTVTMKISLRLYYASFLIPVGNY